MGWRLAIAAAAAAAAAILLRDAAVIVWTPQRSARGSTGYGNVSTSVMVGGVAAPVRGSNQQTCRGTAAGIRLQSGARSAQPAAMMQFWKGHLCRVQMSHGSAFWDQTC